MTAIITRSALLFHGHTIANDVARVEVDHRGRHVITWAQVMEARRERQRHRLEQKRHVEPWRAVRLEVAYYDQFIFGGWQAMLCDWRGHTWSSSCWVDREGKDYREQLMRWFPTGLFNDWENWKPEFAKLYQRGKHHCRPRGVAFLWRRGYELAMNYKEVT